MTDYTARNVLLKDSSGNYLIPYTEKADLSLGNLNSAGKAYVAIKGYDSTATYSLNEVVMTVVSGSVLFYRSLADNNTSSLSDTTKWSEVSFGSGANIDLSNLSNTGEAHFQAPLISGTNIKTINGNSVLGSGDLTVSGGASRNIGEIVTSTIPLVDAGLHLLDGALISGSGSYAEFVTYIAGLYNNNPKTSNVLITGYLTDTDGVLSNFSTTNYAEIPLSFPQSNDAWEMLFKFTTTSDVNTRQTIVSALGGYSINLQLYNGVLYLYLSSNGTSYDIVNSGAGSNTLAANSTYYVKLTFDGSNYTSFISTDGTTYVQDFTVSSSSILNTHTLNLGISRTGIYPPLGSIDLNSCWININDSRAWTGRQSSGFIDETFWQDMVSSYGVCGKFVYDSVNNTVRLPKITGFIEGTTDATALGNLIQAGLPNITGYFNCRSTDSTGEAAGAFYRESGSTGSSSGSTSYSKSPNVNFDASRSSSIYGNSSTVQPQAIKVLVYIVLANSTKTQIEVDIDEIATDLNGKADRDLSNLSNGLANTICVTEATTIRTASSARPAVVVDNYNDGTYWYRVWSDGWIEQGYRSLEKQGSSKTFTYLKPFKTAPTLVVNVWAASGGSGSTVFQHYGYNRTNTGFQVSAGASSYQWDWYACGY